MEDQGAACRRVHEAARVGGSGVVFEKAKFGL
jgi:hypothetical protein